MVFTHKTSLDCTSVESRIEEDAEALGLLLKKHFPFSKNLPSNGFEIREHASVFELCRPSLAAQLLNTQPELNVLMPCRISVYEKEGLCYVSTPDLKKQLEFFDCDATLKADILAMYEEMVAMMQRW